MHWLWISPDFSRIISDYWLIHRGETSNVTYNNHFSVKTFFTYYIKNLYKFIQIYINIYRFPVKFAKFSRAPYLKKTSKRLLVSLPWFLQIFVQRLCCLLSHIGFWWRFHFFIWVSSDDSAVFFQPYTWPIFF